MLVGMGLNWHLAFALLTAVKWSSAQSISDVPQCAVSSILIGSLNPIRLETHW